MHKREDRFSDDLCNASRQTPGKHSNKGRVIISTYSKNGSCNNDSPIMVKQDAKNQTNSDFHRPKTGNFNDNLYSTHTQGRLSHNNTIEC